MKIECCICFEEFSANGIDKILTPKCGHLFHERCLNSWLEKNLSCPQCRLTVTLTDLHYVHLTATQTSRRSSIFNSSLCEDYRQLQENLLTQQEANIKEIEYLKQENEKLKAENNKLKVDMQMEILNREIEKLRKENIKLRSEISHYQGRANDQIEGGYNQTGRSKPPVIRHQSLDQFKNVESVVAKAWRKN